jgi:hypothetical protein
MRDILSEHRHRYEGRGSQVLVGVVDYGRSGRPDLDVRTGRFEGRNMVLGPRAVEDLVSGLKDI